MVQLPNTYTGLTTVDGGSLYLLDTTGPSVPGDLVVNTGGLVSLQADNQTAATSNVTLNGGTFNVGFIPAARSHRYGGLADPQCRHRSDRPGGDLKLNGNVTVGGATQLRRPGSAARSI